VNSWGHAIFALMFLLTYAVGYLVGWLRGRDGTPFKPQPQVGQDTDHGDETIHTVASGMTSLTPARIGVEQRADGSWWLVLSTISGQGYGPLDEQITPQQAMRIARLLRQVQWDGGI
jgi:hypothetical protein